jgi:hypothetical protein
LRRLEVDWRGVDDRTPGSALGQRWLPRRALVCAGVAVSPLRRALLPRAAARDRAAAEAVTALPAYQVALWPDGWQLAADGSVSVCDTHAMAEARRWYDLARRNRARSDPGRALAMHGVYIPQGILDLAKRTFPSEQAASVAVHLVAGDWVRHRRLELLRCAGTAMAERAAAWTGSLHGLAAGADGVQALLARLVDLCVEEGLIPRAGYRLRVRCDDGFGVCGYRVRVETLLESYARARVADVLAVALIPWNRAVARGGRPSLAISLDVAAPSWYQTRS